jgi:hypothetical protein
MGDALQKLKGTAEAALVTIAIASVLLFVVWQLAARPADPPTAELQKDVAFLSDELHTVTQRLERTQARLTVLEREADVLRRANRLLREKESERQAELNSLQSELDFYRRLAGTGGTRTGLDVYQAELVATGSERVFQFILTLTQNIRRASIISGHARIDVEGTLEDRPITLFWPQLGDGDVPEPAFRFKYFQQLDGYLTLPETFIPTRLVVTLEEQGQKTPVQRSYDWSELITAAGG